MRRTEDRRATYLRRRDQEIATAKAWNAAHPDRVRENQRRWSQKNRPWLSEKKKAWVRANRERVNARRRARRLAATMQAGAEGTP